MGPTGQGSKMMVAMRNEKEAAVKKLLVGLALLGATFAAHAAADVLGMCPFC